ncbi:MAG: hypothetical protein E7416_00780 [Ruminococcaceae bacterium]|nr:hypothetical protein [Oscillospiraceae bacterium]
MKKIFVKYGAWVVIGVMFLMLIPGISQRISVESNNNKVTVSFLYSNIANKVSEEKLDSVMDEFKQMGVTTVSVMEDDINYLVARGTVTSIKYNVLCHKYDEQSIQIAKFIKERCPDISYDSHLLFTSDVRLKEFLKYSLPRRFSDADYADVGTIDGLDIYVFYDGRKELWDYALGYNEEQIRILKDKGFDIALVHKVKNYANTEYLEDIDRIVKEYDVEYMNIKSDSYEYDDSEKNHENYRGISDIINSNDMTLVVTENTNQLSNQKCFGYAYIFDNAMKADGPRKVLRSYETYDDTNADETNYLYRTKQFFNSTIDRNLRFITVTLPVPPKVSHDDCADNMIKSTKLFIEKAKRAGYEFAPRTGRVDYTPNKTLNSAICAVIMVMCVLVALEMILGKKSFILTLSAFVLSALAFVGTFVIPASLLVLYPMAYSVVHSCFAMTVFLFFLKKTKDRLPLLALILSGVGVLVGTLLVGAVVQGVLLSGINYYVNNDIFRGIKLSLLVPIAYTAVVFYIMFIKKSKSGFLTDVANMLNANIKVYWLLIGCVVAAVGVYYIIRSGNVNEISSIEQFVRSTLTEIFPARPRTKEFLVGYPAVVLLIYYVKRTNADAVKWILAVAASIVVASVANSFCHVFTDFTTIVSRTINGLIIGACIAFVAYVANFVLVKVAKIVSKKIDTEMR